LVVQGTDEALTRKFFQLALTVIEQELARQEAKDRPVKGSYRDIDTVQIGKQFYAAAAGSALILSNVEKGLHAGIDRYKDGSHKSMAGVEGVAEARKLVPKDPLAFFWLNFDYLKNLPQAKELLAQPRNDAVVTIAFGEFLDLVRRSPFLCAGLYRNPD